MKSNHKIYFTAEIILIVLTLMLSLLTVFDRQIIRVVIDIQFFLYLGILYLNFRRTNAFDLYQVWLVAYVFIIWSEMCIIANKDEFSIGYVTPFLRLTSANVCVLLGYHLGQKKRVFEKKGSQIVGRRFFAVVIIALSVYFIYKKLPTAINNYYGGRSLSIAKGGGGSIVNTLTTALGMILPALIAYYYKYEKQKSTFVIILLVSPIIVLQFFLSTRYKFFFSILPLLIILDVFNIKIGRKKHLLILGISMVLLISASNFIKTNRNYGFANTEESFFSIDNEVPETAKLTLKMASKMSPEGVVRMARNADRYFKDNSLHWGKETSFILYFWIPRSIWTNKPTHLDYWLIREFNPFVPDTYSSASGFIGELRADFGWGCLFFMLLFGLLLRRLDEFCLSVFARDDHSFEMVLVSILFPWIFFFVRSPITSTMALLWELLIYYSMLKLFSKRERLSGGKIKPYEQNIANQCDCK